MTRTDLNKKPKVQPNSSPPPSPGSSSASLKFTLLLTGIFLTLGFFNLLHHEMWRDELQAWMLARASISLADLFHTIRYEGHPGLWHVLLFLLSRVTVNPVAMQLLHLLLATAAIFVAIRYAPFARWQKLVFIFGYFTFFEYATINRQYVLGMLLLFLFCAVYCQTGFRLFTLALVLFGLMQSSVYGLILAFSLGVVVVYDHFITRQSQVRSTLRSGEIIASLFLMVGGVLVFFWQIHPPVEAAYAERLTLNWDYSRFENVIQFVWKTYIPIPKFTFHFWETSFIKPGELRVLFSPLLLGLMVFFFRRNPRALLFYITATALILLLSYFKFLGALRHNGHLYFALIASLWFALATGQISEKDLLLHRWSAALQNKSNWIIGVIFTLQALAGGYANVRDWQHPFSGGKQVAEYLVEKNWQDKTIVGYPDWAASTVAGYLNRELYYPQGDRNGTFVIWDQARQTGTESKIYARIDSLSQQSQLDLLLIANVPLKPTPGRVEFLREFTQSILADEEYYLYIIKHTANDSLQSEALQ